MCLTTAYYDKNGEQTVLAENIIKIDVKGEAVIITDFMGRRTEVFGTVRSVDLENNSIIIKV